MSIADAAARSADVSAMAARRDAVDPGVDQLDGSSLGDTVAPSSSTIGATEEGVTSHHADGAIAPSRGGADGGTLGPENTGDARADRADAAANEAAGVRWIGRVDTTAAGGPRFAWSGSGFLARFTGAGLAVQLRNDGPFLFKAVVDGVPQPSFAAATGQSSYRLATALPDGVHTVALYRQTEGVYGNSQLASVSVEGGNLLDPPAPSGRAIEVVGASVSCGYGDLGVSPCGFSFATESHWDTYEAVAARALDAEVSVVAVSGRGVYRNFDGTTDDTMPKLYDRILTNAATPSWDFHATPQAVIVNLGKNDYAVGDPGVLFRDAYLAFVRALRVRYPNAVIVCATGPNLGAATHALQLARVDEVIAARRMEGDAKITLVDWPEQTAAETGCDAHPTAAKHKAMADQVVAVLRAKLGW